MPAHRKFNDPTDATLAALVREVVPPSHLRRELLGLAPRRESSPFAFWLTALAPLVVVLFVSVLMEIRQPSLEKAQADLAAFLDTDFALSTDPKPIDQLRAWLGARHAPSEFELPAQFSAQIPEGCRIIEWDGLKASLICFYLEGGPTVHLVIFDAGTFRHLPASPLISTSGSWTVAMWKTQSADFLLFGDTDTENLLRLL